MSTSSRSTPHALPTKCGACNRPTESPLFCSGCHTLQPAEDLNLFELLGIERTYDVDPADLRRRYLNVARSIHPDRFSGAADEAMRVSMRLSARLNRAAEVLGDALLRAEYLLELSGGASAATDKSVPPDVLNDALLLREELDEVRAAADDGARAALRAGIQAKFDTLSAAIAAGARQLPGDDDVQRKLRIDLNAAKYYQRLLEQSA